MSVDGDFLRDHCGEEGQELFNRLLVLESECNRAIERGKQERITQLEAEHQELVIERRKLGRELDTLREEESRLNFNAQGIDRRMRDASFALKMLKDHPLNPQYALASELEEHNRKVAIAQKRVDDVLSEQMTHNGFVGGLSSKARVGNEKLAQLNQQVDDVWRSLQRLRGVKLPPRRDAATGLPMP
jgi:hypothetical protein